MAVSETEDKLNADETFGIEAKAAYLDRILTDLFDANWYLVRNPDVAKSGLKPQEHYRNFGQKEQRDPSPFFSCSYYLKANPDVAQSGMHPLEHYFKYGAAENRKPHLYVCPVWLRTMLGTSQNSFVLLDFVSRGGDLPPRPIFDIAHLRRALDLPKTASVPAVMTAFLVSDPADQPAPSPLFDKAYVAKQSEIPDATSALDYYLGAVGKLLSPHQLFNTNFTWANNEALWQRATDAPYFSELTLLELALIADAPANVKSSPLLDIDFYIANAQPDYDPMMLPAQHYITRGSAAGFDPNPYFDDMLYRARYMGKSTHITPLEHYLLHGREPHITLSPRFPDRFYISRYSEVVEHYSDTPLEHYLQFGRYEFRQLGEPVWHDDFACWDDLRADIRTRAAAIVDQAPDIAVIIPVYNEFFFTLRCVWSLLTCGDAARVQVIVADDGSSDETQAYFRDVPGITYVRNPSNMGFLRSCNNATKQAQAPYLFFLNNDTAVVPGALDVLLDTAHALPDAGIVGSKLIYPDGTLQEAGGFIWRDGTGANLGRNSDPEEPAYNLRRDTDYISGAAILVPTALWQDVGGFDELFTPAYCEDSDLAMRLRNLGWRVVYQPGSVVVHFEGVSSGTSTETGVKSYQVTNQKKLREKWEFAMEGHLAPQIVNLRQVRGPTRPRILVIDAIVPEPDKDAGSVTARWYLQLLVELGYDVTFVPTNLLLNGRYGRALQRLGIEVVHEPYVKDLNTYLDTYGADFDLFVLYRVNAGGVFIERLRRQYPDTPVIFNTVDLHFLRTEREAKRKGGAKEDLDAAARTKERELLVMQRATETIILSSTEHELLRGMGVRSPLTVIPLVLENKPDVPPRTGRTGIAFVGGFQHTPNIDAVLYFMKTIWPLLSEAAPDLEVHIVGSNAPPAITSISEPNVIVHGYIEDLDAFLDKRIATIVPLQYGAGIKGKIGSSMAVGVPVVSTTVGAEGMGLTPGQDLLVADSPQGFVAAVLELVAGDDALWATLSRNGQAFVQAQYSAEMTRERLLRLLAKAGVAPFKGCCAITGQTEVRRFLSAQLLDSLATDGKGAWSSERVLAATLTRAAGHDGLPLTRLPAEDLTKAVGTLAITGDMPRLARALKPALTDAATARTVLGRIVLDDTTKTQTAKLLKSIGSNCTRLMLACPSPDKRPTSRRQPPLEQSRLVRQLEAAGWEVRSTVVPLPECALTACNLVEARRKGAKSGKSDAKATS